MTDRQRATIALIAYIVKYNKYSRNLATEVFREDARNTYRYLFEKTFVPGYLSIEVSRPYLTVVGERYVEQAGKLTFQILYKASSWIYEERIVLEIEMDKDRFVGKTPHGNEFEGEFQPAKSREYILIRDPETDRKRFEYVIEYRTL